MKCKATCFFMILISIVIGQEKFAFAQKKTAPAANSVTPEYSPNLYNAMKWRCIGPFCGGRSLAVTGVYGDPLTYYFGATGGGVWKSIDGGDSWQSMQDTNFKSSSVGAIAVAKSNTNIIYAGMGEVAMRNNISFGDGMYKSVDAGKTWKHIGLNNSWAIGKIAVNPQNPDIVFVASMGKVFGAGGERGLYCSKDGGQTWQSAFIC